jgi:hypothetical protein
VWQLAAVRAAATGGVLLVGAALGHVDHAS